MESDWTVFKRGLWGVHRELPLKHLHAQGDECASRHGIRDEDTLV